MAARLRSALALLVPASLLGAAACTADAEPASVRVDATRTLQTAVDNLVDLDNGPPGAIVLVQRGSDRQVYRAGEANVDTAAPPSPRMRMRIASTAKAYSGAVALSLVEDGVLSLDDTIGTRLPWAPVAWSGVTLGQALHHTSGLPDFSANKRFVDHLTNHLKTPVAPRRLLGFVADQDLEFEPGSQYKYSNSDNVVVALMAKSVTGRRYERLLAREVLRPLALTGTSLPRGVRVPRPVMRGYDREPDGTPGDVTELVAAGYAWASGGIVSTPGDQNRFIRGYVGRQLFGRRTQRLQFDWLPAARSEPTGPGRNAAGLGIFRYRTGCGTVYGHTGNTLGYTQFFAASRDGKRSVVVSVNRQTTPTVAPGVFRKVRNVFRLAVCAAEAR